MDTGDSAVVDQGISSIQQVHAHLSDIKGELSHKATWEAMSRQLEEINDLKSKLASSEEATKMLADRLRAEIGDLAEEVARIKSSADLR